MTGVLGFCSFIILILKINLVKIIFIIKLLSEVFIEYYLICNNEIFSLLQPCNCTGPGSLERQCDPRTGQCVCASGFEGHQCTECSVGHYGKFCTPCNCVVAGTNPLNCDVMGKCQCDNNGQCPCKVKYFFDML